MDQCVKRMVISAVMKLFLMVFPSLSGWGVTLTPHPLLVPSEEKEKLYLGHTACTKPHCLYKGALYLYLFTFPYLPRIISKWVSHEQDEYLNYNDLSLTKFPINI